ncbi:MAG: hypothetical protein ACI4T8_04345 [Christensenellales bacterium]
MKKVFICMLIGFCAFVSFCYISLKGIGSVAEYTYFLDNHTKLHFENAIDLGEVNNSTVISDYILSGSMGANIIGVKARLTGSMVEVNRLVDKLGAVIVDRKYQNGIVILSAYSKRVPFCEIEGKNIEVVYYDKNITVGFPIIFK